MAITASLIPVILDKLENRNFGGRIAADSRVNVAAFDLVRRVQTAQFSELIGAKKNRVKVWWMEWCDSDTVTDCSTICDINGTPIDTDAVEYELNECKKPIDKSVPTFALEDNAITREEMLAFTIDRQMRALDHFLVQELIRFLNANSGVNVWDGPKWTFSGPSTIGNHFSDIPVSNLNKINIAHNLLYAADQNSFVDPTILTGWMMSEAVFEAQVNAGNEGQRDGAFRLSALPQIVVDTINVEKVNTTATLMYLVSQGALAFVNRARYEARPQQHQFKTMFSRESQNLSGVFYDVTFDQSCSGNDLFDSVRVEVRYDYLLNPLGCNPTNTGILKFRQVADPAPAVLGAAKAKI